MCHVQRTSAGGKAVKLTGLLLIPRLPWGPTSQKNKEKSVAELAFGMLVQRCRNSYDGSTSRELRGRKLGLIGCGLVGIYMARIGQGLIRRGRCCL